MTDRQKNRDNLSAYLDGELGDADRARIEEALKQDSALAAELEALRKTREMVRALPRRQASGDFVANVLAQAERLRLVSGHHAHGGAERSLGWVRYIATAAVLLIAAGVGVVVMAMLWTTSSFETRQAAMSRNGDAKPAEPVVAAKGSGDEWADRDVKDADAARGYSVVIAKSGERDETGAMRRGMGKGGYSKAGPAAGANYKTAAKNADMPEPEVTEVMYVDNLDVAAKEVARVLAYNGANANMRPRKQLSDGTEQVAIEAEVPPERMARVQSALVKMQNSQSPGAQAVFARNTTPPKPLPAAGPAPLDSLAREKRAALGDEDLRIGEMIGKAGAESRVRRPAEIKDRESAAKDAAPAASAVPVAAKGEESPAAPRAYYGKAATAPSRVAAKAELERPTPPAASPAKAAEDYSRYESKAGVASLQQVAKVAEALPAPQQVVADAITPGGNACTGQQLVIGGGQDYGFALGRGFDLEMSGAIAGNRVVVRGGTLCVNSGGIVPPWRTYAIASIFYDPSLYGPSPYDSWLGVSRSAITKDGSGVLNLAGGTGGWQATGGSLTYSGHGQLKAGLSDNSIDVTAATVAPATNKAVASQFNQQAVVNQAVANTLNRTRVDSPVPTALQTNVSQQAPAHIEGTGQVVTVNGGTPSLAEGSQHLADSLRAAAPASAASAPAVAGQGDQSQQAFPMNQSQQARRANQRLVVLLNGNVDARQQAPPNQLAPASRPASSLAAPPATAK